MWEYDVIAGCDVYKPELAGKTPLEVLAAFGMRGRVILGGVNVPEAAYNAPQENEPMETPTEKEINQCYLVANGWRLQCETPSESVWTDPLDECDYFFERALDIQEGRDMLDGADDLRAALRRSENGARAEMEGITDETPLGELYGGK